MLAVYTSVVHHSWLADIHANLLLLLADQWLRGPYQNACAGPGASQLS